MSFSSETFYEVETTLRGIFDKNPIEALGQLADKFAGKAVFSTSFGIEDQVVSHLIFANKLPIRVFTLDTGRQFKETYDTWSRTLDRYRQPIAVFTPDTTALQEMVTTKGPNAFYESVENRKQCCHIRKIEPLSRALRGQQLWITGIRAEQSANRNNMTKFEWDDAHGLFKFHPLFDWTMAELRDYVGRHNIPYNPLHDQGFVSIGCAPCTRAIALGEDFRAGRWWWEDSTKKECGLHEVRQDAVLA